MTQKGFEVLIAIIEKIGADVIDKVISARDVKISNDYFLEIKGVCDKYKLPFFEKNELPQVDTEYAIAISWRWLINLEQTRLITLHDSLLPKYRGFAPLVNALINGESLCGVTAIFSGDEFDKGDIIMQSEILIKYPIKIQQAIEKISIIYIDIAIEIIKNIKKGITIKSEPQDEDKATYSLWLNDDDYFIDWSKNAEEIKRFIDSVGKPYKGACSYDGEKICIFEDAIVEDDLIIENRKFGKVLFVRNNEPIVVCGKGLLRIIKVTDEIGNNLLPLNKFRTIFYKL
jgi:methionyl-tRNA formyltransferase